MLVSHTLSHSLDCLLAEKVITLTDKRRILESYKTEGIGFTRVLQQLEADVLSGIRNYKYVSSPETRRNFSHGRSCLPGFLRRLTYRLFDHRTGDILECADHVALQYLRQICSAMKKVAPESKKAKERLFNECVDKFVSTQNEAYTKRAETQDWILKNRGLWRCIEQEFNVLLDFPTASERPDLYSVNIPPGASQERLEAALAADWYWNDDLLGRGLINHLLDKGQLLGKKFVTVDTKDVGKYENLDLAVVDYHLRSHFTRKEVFKVKRDLGMSAHLAPTNGQVKFTAVPKSYKAYRGVSTMRTLDMLRQLAWQRAFYKNLPDCLPLENQELMALNLRLNFDVVGTGDMEDGSNRIFWWILDLLLRNNKHRDFIQAVRTKSVLLPDGRVQECLSPLMGEGITFPLMSAYFAAIARAVAIYYHGGKWLETIKCFGDDIQTPYFDETLFVLKMLGSVPNIGKSYPPSSCFKESCEYHAFLCPADRMYRDGRVGVYPTRPIKYPINCKPNYFFDYRVHHDDSGERIGAVTALRLFAVAEKMHGTTPIFSKAIADVLETDYFRAKMPCVPPGVGLLGRYSSCVNESWSSQINTVLTESNPLSLSQFGVIMDKLRFSDQEEDKFGDTRLLIKLARSKPRLVITDLWPKFTRDLQHSAAYLASLDDPARANEYAPIYFSSLVNTLTSLQNRVVTSVSS